MFSGDRLTASSPYEANLAASQSKANCFASIPELLISEKTVCNDWKTRQDKLWQVLNKLNSNDEKVIFHKHVSLLLQVVTKQRLVTQVYSWPSARLTSHVNELPVCLQNPPNIAKLCQTVPQLLTAGKALEFPGPGVRPVQCSGSLYKPRQDCRAGTCRVRQKGPEGRLVTR